MSVLPPLEWPDAVAIVCDYLRVGIGAGTTVGATRTDPLTPPLVVVERAGGLRASTWDTPRIALQCWAATPAGALDLTNACRDLLAHMVGLFDGFIVTGTQEFLGPTYALDPETTLPRYLLTVEARIRANPKT